MSSHDRNDWLMDKIRQIAEFLKEGCWSELDFTTIEKEAPELAENFYKVAKNIDSVRNTISPYAHDVPKMNEYLTHIAKTTETGVTTVLNIAEAVMSDTSKVKESLANLSTHLAQFTGNESLQDELRGAQSILDNLQDNCFTILTSLEFEDINRQLTEKIIDRLDEMYANFLDILLVLNIPETPGNGDSPFVKSLKRIFDIEDAGRHDQKVADKLFEEF
jgi:chemotaxis regulatin CheY-phosphate phosphatase CheZ